MRKAVIFSAVLLSAVFSSYERYAFGADVQLKTRVSALWKPYTNESAFDEELRFIEGLLDRRLGELAAEELERIDETALKEAEPNDRARYAACAVRAAMETSKLDTAEARSDVETHINAIRQRVPNEGLVSPEYELAYVRAMHALGTLAVDEAEAAKSAAKAQDADQTQGMTAEFGGRETNEEAARYFTEAAEAARIAGETLRPADAKPFLYWYAKALLANAADPRRIEKAEKCASALEKASLRALDENYFYARLALIEAAREAGNVQEASKRVAETLDALKKAASRPNAPLEIAVGLVEQETQNLFAEGKADEALKTAAQNYDLLGEPLPENIGRYADRFADLFGERSLARAKAFWNAAADAPDDEDAQITNAPTKKSLIEGAKRSTAELRGNVWRARASFFMRAAGDAVADWTALEASAAESFHAERFAEAIERYDRAAQEAEDSDAPDDAYRLRGIAAGVVDKICRDKTFDAVPNKSEQEWNADARDRFIALAKERPENELAPSFYLLGLERAGKLGDDLELREDYLRSFPNAEGRGAFALDLARREFASGRVAEARAALDEIAPSDGVFPEALALERKIYDAQDHDDADDAYLAEIARLLSKTTPFAERRIEIQDAGALSAALVELAESLDAQTLTPSDSDVLAAIAELSAQSELRKTAELADALNAALDSWEQAETDRDRAAQIRSLRLTLAVDVQTPAELMRLLGDDDMSSPAALDALDRVLAHAETAQVKTRGQIAQFALKALEHADAKSDRAALLRADALRLNGQAQDALNLYASLRKKNPKNARAIRGIALLLTSRKDAKTLEQGAKYWTELADLYAPGSPEWWDAKEQTIRVYCKIGKVELAEKALKTLWLTRSDPSDPLRKERWEKLVRESKKR